MQNPSVRISQFSLVIITNSIACRALPSHHLPIHFSHLLANAAQLDTCPVGKRRLLLPPHLLTKLTTKQWQRCTVPTPSTYLFPVMREALHRAWPRIAHLWLVVWNRISAQSPKVGTPVALPSCPCPPSFPVINPSMWSLLPWLCFMTPGLPRVWEGLKKRSKKLFDSFYTLLCMTTSSEQLLRFMIQWPCC